MQDTRSQRWLGVAGVVFVVLIVMAVVTSTNTTSTDTAAKVVSNVHKHKGGLQASAWITGLAVLEGLAFLWYFREFLCDVLANRRLASLAYAGGIVFAVSGALSAGLKFSMADAVNHVDPNVLQGLNVLQNDLTMFVGGAGTALFLIANSVAIIRNGPLAPWIGWVGIVLGVVGAVIGAPATGLWLLIVSIAILMRAQNVAQVAAVAA